MNITRSRQLELLALLFVLVVLGAACRTQDEVLLATTTSVHDAGLLDELLPRFEARTGYRVKPLVVGSGQALALAARGEVDVVITHSPQDERRLLEEGVVVERHLVMYNHFVLLGPPEDPAGVRGLSDPREAFRRIAAAGAIFLSRGDSSGTHVKEMELWKAAGVSPAGAWYQESGTGMGETLRIASEKGAYTLADWGTFLALRHQLRLEPFVRGGSMLVNPYHVMAVNGARFSRVNAEGAAALVQFLLSEQAQAVIARFGTRQYGEPLFIPAAGLTEEELSGGGR